MENYKQIEVQIINAFVDDNKGGNPAGLVLNADNLTTEEKLIIAKKVGLSETAFVSKSSIADYKLDFFTPTKQIPHCGHATIATFSYLRQTGLLKNKFSSKETIDGIREIFIQDDLAFMEQKSPVYSDIKKYKERVLSSLNLNENDVLSGFPISIVNTGNPFLIIPVRNAEVLKTIDPNFYLVNQISEELNLAGFYVFCTQTNDPERDANARMFAPRYGINEEAGTGMAAGPLACYLHEKMGLRKNRFLIEQGWFMDTPSKSLIIVDLTIENGAVSKLMAGGKGIPMSSMSLAI